MPASVSVYIGKFIARKGGGELIPDFIHYSSNYLKDYKLFTNTAHFYWFCIRA